MLEYTFKDNLLLCFTRNWIGKVSFIDCIVECVLTFVCRANEHIEPCEYDIHRYIYINIYKYIMYNTYITLLRSFFDHRSSNQMRLNSSLLHEKHCERYAYHTSIFIKLAVARKWKSDDSLILSWTSDCVQTVVDIGQAARLRLHLNVLKVHV